MENSHETQYSAPQYIKYNLSTLTDEISVSSFVWYIIELCRFHQKGFVLFAVSYVVIMLFYLLNTYCPQLNIIYLKNLQIK